MGGRPPYPVRAIQARQDIAARRPLTAPDFHLEWNALLPKPDRGVSIALWLRAAEIAVMLAGWFGLGFLLGMLFLQ